MKPSREKEDPFISLETGVIRRHTCTEFSSLTPRTKVEQNKAFVPLLCLSLIFKSWLHESSCEFPCVNFVYGISFSTAHIWYCLFRYFEYIFSSPLRTYFYDINFRSPFKQSHRIPQIPYFPNTSNFSPWRDPLTYIVVHTLCILFSIPFVLWCFTLPAFWGAHCQVPR